MPRAGRAEETCTHPKRIQRFGKVDMVDMVDIVDAVDVVDTVDVVCGFLKATQISER